MTDSDGQAFFLEDTYLGALQCFVFVGSLFNLNFWWNELLFFVLNSWCCERNLRSQSSSLQFVSSGLLHTGVLADRLNTPPSITTVTPLYMQGDVTIHLIGGIHCRKKKKKKAILIRQPSRFLCIAVVVFHVQIYFAVA